VRNDFIRTGGLEKGKDITEIKAGARKYYYSPLLRT
jgi:hypothetical protein